MNEEEVICGGSELRYPKKKKVGRKEHEFKGGPSQYPEEAVALAFFSQGPHRI